MIPKRAWFYWGSWSGVPMSWLRRQSVETFQRFNPSWECAFIHRGVPIGPPSLRGSVLSSDRERYAQLAETGGMYFDTDIIFTAPIPEEWLSKDNCIVSRDGKSQGIAVLGSKPGSKFFAGLVHDCDERLKSKVILAYQSLGIKLFVGKDTRQMASVVGESLYEIPIELMFPVPWGGVEQLWSDINIPVRPDAVGVHWFGGDELSREYEPKITPDTLDDYPCLITSVLKSQVIA